MEYTGPSSLNIGTDKQREAFKKLAEQYGDLCNLCGERGHWANECDTVHKLREMEKNKAFHQYNQPIMPPPTPNEGFPQYNQSNMPPQPPTAAKFWNQSTAPRNPYTAPRNPYAKRSTGGAYHESFTRGPEERSPEHKKSRSNMPGKVSPYFE